MLLNDRMTFIVEFFQLCGDYGSYLVENRIKNVGNDETNGTGTVRF